MSPILYLIGGALLVIVMTLVLRKISESSTDSIFDKEEELEVFKIVDESHNVKSFYLKRLNNQKFSKFRPGQFLSFQIGKSKRLYRSYSLSSTNSDLSYYRISIKLLENGVGSNWFFKLKVGDKIVAHPPTGLFSDDQVSSEVKRIYIAGGIGITPFIPMIENAGTQNIAVDLFYGMRSEEDMVFHKELEEYANRYSSFNYFPILSESKTFWSGLKGFINIDLIKEKSTLNGDEVYYLCGPKPMTDSVINSLSENDKYFIEEFFTETTTSGTKDIDCTITFNKTKLSYSGHQNILDFLEDKEQDVLFSCRSGVCGACKCKLVIGNVKSLTDSGLTDEEKKEGYILTCVSTPLEDIELESDL